MDNLPGPRGRLDLSRFGGKAAVAVIGLGLLLIGVGWNGVASQDSLLEQLPYLVSGGLIGLAVVVVGAAVMIVHGARDDRARLEAKLDEVVDALTAGGYYGGVRAETPQDISDLVVAGTASYHLPRCRLVEGREGLTYLTPDEAEQARLKPCRVCMPDGSNVSVR